MVGYLTGTVKGMVRDTVVVMTATGVGYGAYVPAATLARVSEGDALALWTHLAVRENAHDLYGFETKEELQWFELLLTVSGVGPRSALSILNAADIATLQRAIGQEDASVLTSAYGIGRKTAEKVVLELRDKVGVDPSTGSGQGKGDEVVEALITLGYSTKEARDAVRTIPKDLATTEEKIREALRYASKN
jgi:Holliday junction DNA helicase RuvA